MDDAVRLLRYFTVPGSWPTVHGFIGSDGRKYFTDNAWLATLYKKAVDDGKPRDFLSNAGGSGRWLITIPRTVTQVSA